MAAVATAFILAPWALAKLILLTVLLAAIAARADAGIVLSASKTERGEMQLRVARYPALGAWLQSSLAVSPLAALPGFETTPYQESLYRLSSAAEGVARLTLGTGLTALSGLRGDPDPERVVGPLEHLLQALFALLLGVSYLAATLGVVWLIRKREFASLATVVVFLLYFVLISAGPEANTRFRIPAMPFIAILGGVGLAGLQKPDSRDPANLRL